MNETAQAADLANPTWKRVDELADLTEIFDPDIQICTWARKVDPQIKEYIGQINPTETFQGIETSNASGPLSMYRLPPAPARQALVDDLAFLRDIVHELLGCPKIGMRIAHISHTMCPGWHIDRTGIRLVCTYKGPGTEWLNDQTADRSKLSSEEYLMMPHHQASEAEIVLLKGDFWQGNESFGAIHRSPKVNPENGLRMLVTLDSLWEE